MILSRSSLPFLLRKYTSVFVAAAILSLVFIHFALSDEDGITNRLNRLYHGPDWEPPVARGVPLRIMALGASVCRGDVSTGNVGFRQPLREHLVRIGNPVNMVGSVRVGEMKDNDVEAIGGHRVDHAHKDVKKSVPVMKPNLFIINLGSNDCLQHHDLRNYYKRLHELVDYLLAESPKATVILSTLLTNTVPNTEPCILDINDQIRKLYPILKSQGKPVVFVEMHDKFIPAGDPLPRPHPENITPDGTHPDDQGYGMMAKIYMTGIRDAEKQGFLQHPEDVGIPDDGNYERDMQALLKAEDDAKHPGQGKGKGTSGDDSKGTPVVGGQPSPSPEWGVPRPSPSPEWGVPQPSPSPEWGVPRPSPSPEWGVPLPSPSPPPPAS